MHVWVERNGWWFVTLLTQGLSYALEIDERRHLRLRGLDAAGAGATGTGASDARASDAGAADAGAAGAGTSGKHQLGGEVAAGIEGEDVVAPSAASAPRLVPDARGWVLLAPRAAAVSVDGVEASAGIRSLRDGAEIRMEGSVRAFFSSEELARIEPAPAAIKSELTCPRCQSAIAQGSPAVRCVGCGVWYHQDSEQGLSCFTYSPTCTLCGHETSLEGGFRWTPQDAGFGAVAEEVTP